MDLHRTPLTGTIADRYEIRREAGRGGMAVVYLAWDLRHDRPVALKVLRPEVGMALGAERFLREIQITAHLSHPHVLAVVDSGLLELPGGGALPWYVMPFIDGPTLADRLASEGRLTVDESLRIAAEVADALQYAHTRGVIHRDIKPANILLHEGHALVADFGVARAREEGSTIVTTAGMAIGTMHYMSPEQFTADPEIDGRSDIYGLGCVLFEMLAGEPPFTGVTPQAVCARHQAERPRDLCDVRPDVNEATQRTVARSLAKAPKDRFPTAAEFRDSLTRLRNISGITPPLSKRRALPVAAFVTVLALIAVLMWWSQRPASPASVVAALPVTRILVRPFESQGSDSFRARGDLLTESLTDKLQAVPDLAVTAYAMVKPYSNAPLDTLRLRFPVDRVVTGTLVQVGDSMTLTTRLIDPPTGQQLQSRSWTMASSTSHSTVVEALSTFIRQTLWRERVRATRRLQVRDDSAWTLVEAALGLRRQADQAITFRADAQGFRTLDQADSLLELARQRDEASVLIPLEVARTADLRAYLTEYIPQRLDGAADRLPSPAIARAKALSEVSRVLERHPRNADALELRGEIRLGLFRVLGADSSVNGAIADLEQATAVDASAVVSWRELSRAYLMSGRYPESMMAIEQATRVDPYQVNRNELLRGRFEIALLVGDFGKAGKDCATGLREFRDDERFVDCEIELWGRSRNDRASAARAMALTDSLGRAVDDPLFTAHRYLWASSILARASLGDSADRVAARVLGALDPSRIPTSLLVEAAALRLQRGQADSALVLIALATRRNRGEVPYLRGAPWFRLLRDDPRFGAALAGISPREATTPP